MSKPAVFLGRENFGEDNMDSLGSGSFANSDEISTGFSFPQGYWLTTRVYLSQSQSLAPNLQNFCPTLFMLLLFHNKMRVRGHCAKPQVFLAYILVVPRGQQNSRTHLLRSPWNVHFLIWRIVGFSFLFGSFLTQLLFKKKWLIFNSLILA